MRAHHHGPAASGERPEQISGNERPGTTIDNIGETTAISTRSRDASQAPVREGFQCASCGRFNVTGVAGLFATRRAGSAQRFCDPACQQTTYRRRRAGVDEDAPRQPTGGRSRRLNPSPDHNAGRPPTSPKPERPTRKGQYLAIIPTARDRIVQASLKLVLEPIFEADFKPCSYDSRRMIPRIRGGHGE